MVEVRSTQQVCGSQCSTFGCYKGGDATSVTFPQALPTEGQATGAAPSIPTRPSFRTTATVCCA
jgi:hypothetical protein